MIVEMLGIVSLDIYCQQDNMAGLLTDEQMLASRAEPVGDIHAFMLNITICGIRKSSELP